MKIAICDDTLTDLKAILELVQAYGERRGQPVTCSTFSSGAAFLDRVQGGARYDVVLMDVLMPGLDGIESARALRQIDGCAQLVFLTVSPNFVVEAFSVKARHYLIKPITEPAVFLLLDEIGAELERDGREAIIVRGKHGIRKLRVDRLEYCEIMRRTVCYHTADGAVVEGEGSMGELEAQLLSFPMFLRPHRSFLVNMEHIACLDGKSRTLTMGSMVSIPIPKLKYAEVREAYAGWLQRRKSAGGGG